MKIASCVEGSQPTLIQYSVKPCVDFKKNRYEIYIQGCQQGFNIGEALVKRDTFIILKEDAARSVDLEFQTNIPRFQYPFPKKMATRQKDYHLDESLQVDPVKAFQAGFVMGAQRKEDILYEQAFVLDKGDMPAYNKSKYDQGVIDTKKSCDNVIQRMKDSCDFEKLLERKQNVRNGFLIGAVTAGVAIGTTAYLCSKKS